MLSFILDVVAVVRVFFICRTNLALEILALRQQVAVLKRKRPRPKLNSMDRLFWTALRGLWSRWAEALLIVKPETVVQWHRAGFRLYWRWRSRGPAGGRRRLTLEVRELIQRMAEDNPGWGAPRIHGELLKLGFVLSERSVSRYLRVFLRRGDPGERWLAFLRNHREAIVALDFFTVPTARFQVLYCLFVIEHIHEQHLRRLVGDFVAYYHLDRIHEGLAKDAPNRRAVENQPSSEAKVISSPRLGGLHHRYGWQQAA